MGNSCFLITVTKGWNSQNRFWDGMMAGHSHLITFCGVTRQCLMLVGSRINTIVITGHLKIHPDHCVEKARCHPKVTPGVASQHPHLLNLAF
jgi:hypothetical protein